MLHEILTKLAQHAVLTFSSLGIACLIGLPLGMYLTRIKSKKVAHAVIRISGLIQTVPGLAMLALIVVALVSLRAFVDLPTTGRLPATCALCLYALFPILTNTYTGIKQVSPAMVEVAKGMGMTRSQILFWVEVPNAVPFIMTGIQISAIWTIGMATLTSLIGSGGLGDLIMQGLRSMQLDLVLAGTIPAGIFALTCEWGINRLKLWLMPR